MPFVALHNYLEHLHPSAAKLLHIHADELALMWGSISKYHIISVSIILPSKTFLKLFNRDTHQTSFSLPPLLEKDKGQKQCEIMSLLSEKLYPLYFETTCVKPGFMRRQPRRVLEGRQGVSSIRPLCSPGCHKPLISHSAHRAVLTPTACTPLSYLTNCTHLHSGDMLLHLTMCGNTGLCMVWFIR